MKVLLLFISIIFTFSSNLIGQERYFEKIFLEVNEESQVYAQGKDFNGNNQDLNVDIFTPKDDDTQQRPLLILLHGGGFIGGDRKEEELVYWAKSMVARGYVCMSVQYRLGVITSNFLNIPSEVAKATWRATLDTRAVIQFAKANADFYKIDAEKIFLVGVSAGAIASIHSQMLDTDTEIASASPRINTSETELIVPEKYKEHTFRCRGIINLCGAIGNLEWMRNNTNYKLLNIHGDKDPTIPYKTGPFRVGPLLITTLSGSFAIDSMANVLGMKSKLHTFWGSEHVPFSPRGSNAANSKKYIDSVEILLRDFLWEDIRESSVSVDKMKDWESIKIFPNPVKDWLMVQNLTKTNNRIQILSTQGTTIKDLEIQNSNQSIYVGDMSEGMYILRYFDKNNIINILKLFVIK